MKYRLLAPIKIIFLPLQLLMISRNEATYRQHTRNQYRPPKWLSICTLIPRTFLSLFLVNFRIFISVLNACNHSPINIYFIIYYCQNKRNHGENGGQAIISSPAVKKFTVIFTFGHVTLLGRLFKFLRPESHAQLRFFERWLLWDWNVLRHDHASSATSVVWLGIFVENATKLRVHIYLTVFKFEICCVIGICHYI